MHAMNCIICLRHENIVNITQKKDNDVNDTLKLKLHFLVPEVVCFCHISNKLLEIYFLELVGSLPYM